MTATPLKLAGADGLTLAVDSFGPLRGPPVLFLHGGGQSRSAWRGGAHAVAAAGYRALSLDLRGHGHSGWSPDGDYFFTTYARDLAAVIPQLGGNAALVGASLGGRVALMAAARWPDLVAAVALADVAPRIDESATGEMRAFFRSARKGFDSLEEAAAMLATLRETRTNQPLEKLRPLLREEEGRLYWRWDPAFADERFIGAPEELDMLENAARGVVAPMIMIRAQHSTVVHPEHLAQFHALVPHSEVAEAPGIGHMLTGDANDAYAPIILDFLRRHYPLPG